MGDPTILLLCSLAAGFTSLQNACTLGRGAFVRSFGICRVIAVDDFLVKMPKNLLYYLFMAMKLRRGASQIHKATGMTRHYFELGIAFGHVGL